MSATTCNIPRKTKLNWGINACHTVRDVYVYMTGFMVVVLELVNMKHHTFVFTSAQAALQSRTLVSMEVYC